MSYTDSRHKVFGHLERIALWQHGQKPAPVTVEWDLSNRCPLGCPDCHFAHLRTRGPLTTGPSVLYEPCGDLADEVVVRRGLLEMATAGVQGVVWSGGGEPLTHPHWWQIVDYAHSLGLHQGMYTSGVVLTPESSLWLAERLAWVVISLDAIDADTYATDKQCSPGIFDLVCRNIENLASLGQIVVSVSFLLREANWQRAPEMAALAERLKATYTTFRPAIVVDPEDPATCLEDRRWITKAVPMLRDLAKSPDVELDVARFEAYQAWTGRAYDACYGIRFSTVITPDGRVWECCQRRGMRDSCIGDLRVTSFPMIWETHPGLRTDFSSCRVMCRLHLMNESLAMVYADRPHGAFL